jgi:REP element-mobilizing transposase RayT
MPQSLSAVYVQVVFSTKERCPFLKEPLLRAEMHAFLGSLSKRLNCPCIIIGYTADHIHQMIRLNRTITQDEWVKEIKRASSLWIKQRESRLYRFAWQAGYGAFSVSSANLSVVREYIATQEEHHKKISFQDEYRMLLEQHGLEWDEQYVWD